MLGAMRKVMRESERIPRSAMVPVPACPPLACAAFEMIKNRRHGRQKHEITVTARTTFMPEQSDVERRPLRFAYTITILNTGRSRRS